MPSFPHPSFQQQEPPDIDLNDVNRQFCRANSLDCSSITLGLDRWNDATPEERREIDARVQAYHRGDPNWMKAKPSNGYPNIRSTP